MRLLVLLASGVIAACAAAPEAPPSPTLAPQASGADALLIAAHAVDARTVWAAGTGGTVTRTVDGGATWTAGTVPGADSLQFRDVHAWSAREAAVLSIGNGEDSRVYRTTDGGATWRETFRNRAPEAFYDCFAFWRDGSGLLFSDSVDGRFLFQRTADRGATWEPVPPEALPPAQPGEGSFASSGTCLATREGTTAWQVTGNAETPRLLATEDRGATWTTADLPLAGGEAAGGASVAFGAGGRALAVGGDIADAGAMSDAVAVWDGGAWRAGGALPFTGAAYGVAFVPGTASGAPASGAPASGAGSPEAALAVGPGGVALSRDGGASWSLLSGETHWGLAVAERRAWLVGPDGRVTLVRF